MVSSIITQYCTMGNWEKASALTFFHPLIGCETTSKFAGGVKDLHGIFGAHFQKLHPLLQHFLTMNVFWLMKCFTLLQNIWSHETQYSMTKCFCKRDKIIGNIPPTQSALVQQVYHWIYTEISIKCTANSFPTRMRMEEVWEWIVPNWTDLSKEV